MFISYHKVSSLGQKKLELFKKMFATSILPGFELSTDEVIKKYTTEEDHFLMAKLAGNNVAGAVAYRLDGYEAYIGHIAVSKKYRKNGHGRELINYIIDQGCVQKIYLECGMDSATFFEKVDFKVVDQFTDLKGNKKFKFERRIDKQAIY